MRIIKRGGQWLGYLQSQVYSMVHCTSYRGRFGAQSFFILRRTASIFCFLVILDWVRNQLMLAG